MSYYRQPYQSQTPAPAPQAPATPYQIPHSQDPGNPFAGINRRKDLNFGSVLRYAGNMYGTNQQNRSQYLDAANAAYNQHMNGPLAQQMLSGLGQAFQPVISQSQLGAMQSAGRDRVATEGQTLQDALRAQLAAQGQSVNSVNPAFIGAAYNTAYQAGQSDINQQFQASQLNKQGLQAALSQGNAMYGLQGQDRKSVV